MRVIQEPGPSTSGTASTGPGRRRAAPGWVKAMMWSSTCVAALRRAGVLDHIHGTMMTVLRTLTTNKARNHRAVDDQVCPPYTTTPRLRSPPARSRGRDAFFYRILLGAISCFGAWFQNRNR